jgi:hypothetical protein
LSKSPGFPRDPGPVGTVSRQADAVRAEHPSVQTVTGPTPRGDASARTNATLLADSSAGGIGYNAAGSQRTAGQRAQAQRAASGQVPGSGLVNNRISARNADRRTVRLEIGYRDVRIHRSLGLTRHEQRRGGGKRGRISEFSAASARRLLFCARNFPGLSVMVTLTYPGDFPCDGRTVKSHWRRMRQWFLRHGNPSGLWFLEFQARGAPHFHVFLPCEVPMKDVAEAWYAIVGSGDIRHLWAGTRTEALRNPHAAGAYAAKYASKTVQKEVPEGFSDVGRFWGIWGQARICEETVLPWREAVPLVRAVRRAYKNRRKSWKCAKRFRDNGTAGFTGWESGPLAAQALRRLTRCDSGLILGLERINGNGYGKGRGATASNEPSNHRIQAGRHHHSAPIERNHQDSERRSLGSLSRSELLRSG